MASVLTAIQGIIDAFIQLSLINKVLIIVFFLVLGIFFGNPLIINHDDPKPLPSVTNHDDPKPPILDSSSENTLWALYKGKRLTELALPLYTTLPLELAPPFSGSITEYQQFSGKGSNNYFNTNIPIALGYSSGETVRTQFMVGLTGDYDVWYMITDSSNKVIYESNHITISSL